MQDPAMKSALAFDCIGPKNAPVLLLSAGLGGLAAYWTPQLEALAATHRVVLLDHRGTGRNRGPLPAGLTIADRRRTRWPCWTSSASRDAASSGTLSAV